MSGGSTAHTIKPPPRSAVLAEENREVLAGAEQAGLLGGGRTKNIRVRVPMALVTEAKKRSGVESDAELIELALAKIAMSDHYGEWLLSRRGTIDTSIDLDY